MKIIKGLNEISKNVVLTIGNFDGVHAGHRYFLQQLKSLAQQDDCLLAVMTFVPHPRQILSPTNDFLINTYDERRMLLRELGVDYLYEINFTRDFSTLGPIDFLDQYVAPCSKIKDIFIGHDFAFGAKKSGNHELMKNYCSTKGIGFFLGEEFQLKGKNVSSTTVRESLKNADMHLAKELLQRDFFMSGRVIKGFGRGKKIGFPTANLQYAVDRIIPKEGVYVTKTFCDGAYYISVTNIGLNPTFEGVEKVSIETHLLDFNRDIYGDEIRVHFIEFMRGEVRFHSINELIAQLNKDIQLARSLGSP